LYLILPFSITGASLLSKKITLPLIAEAQSGFRTIEKDFSSESLSEKIFPADEKEESFLAQINLKTQYTKVKNKIIKLGTFFKDKTRSMAIWTINIIAGYLFDCLIFPLIFFIILFIFIKGMVSYLLGIKREKKKKKDLDLMFSKYYGHRFEKRAGVEDIDPVKS
jgi:Ca2+-dependent lipid-binding protein